MAVLSEQGVPVEQVVPLPVGDANRDAPQTWVVARERSINKVLKTYPIALPLDVKRIN